MQKRFIRKSRPSPLRRAFTLALGALSLFLFALGFLATEQYHAVLDSHAGIGAQAALAGLVVVTFGSLVWFLFLVGGKNRLNRMTTGTAVLAVALFAMAMLETPATASHPGFSVEETSLLSDQILKRAGCDSCAYLARVRNEIRAVVTLSRMLIQTPKAVCPNYDGRDLYACYREQVLSISEKTPLTISGQLMLTYAGIVVNMAMGNALKGKGLDRHEKREYTNTIALDALDGAILNTEILATKRLTASRLLGHPEEENAEWGNEARELRGKGLLNVEAWRRTVPLMDSVFAGVFTAEFAKRDNILSRFIADIETRRPFFTASQADRLEQLKRRYEVLRDECRPAAHQLSLLDGEPGAR